MLGETDEGALPLAAGVQRRAEDGKHLLVLQMGEETQGSAAPARLTVAFSEDGEAVEIVHQQDLDATARLGELSISIPDPVEGLVGVLLEDLSSGAWGAAYASVLEGQMESDSLPAVVDTGVDDAERRAQRRRRRQRPRTGPRAPGVARARRGPGSGGSRR